MADLQTKMPSIKLNDGVEIPVLGYGTGTAMFKWEGTSTIDRDRVEQIKTAIKVGYHHLDGAEVYNTEAELGTAIQESKVERSKLFVTTKVYGSVKDILNAIDTSLRKLKLDYVDLLAQFPLMGNIC